MDVESAQRRVRVERLGPARFEVLNDRGGRVTLGNGESTHLTPIEMLLGAIGACSAMDVEPVTSRRAEPDTFTVEVTGSKIRDVDGNQLDDIRVVFHARFPDGDDGDEARQVLPKIVQRAHDQLCTVSRTVELGSPVTMTIAG
ncbi:MAG: OsmC family protein [Desertimonas sp.]